MVGILQAGTASVHESALPVFWHAARCTTCFARRTTCFAREVPGPRLNPLTARPAARLSAPYLACDLLPHGPYGESPAAVAARSDGLDVAHSRELRTADRWWHFTFH